MNDDHTRLSALHEVQTLIHAAPEKVFETLADIPAWQDWQPGIRILQCDSPAEGSTFRYSDSGITIQSEITEFVPFERIAWKSRSLWMKAEISFTIESDHGDTYLTFEQTLFGFGAKMFHPIMKRSMELLMAQLVKYSELSAVPVYS